MTKVAILGTAPAYYEDLATHEHILPGQPIPSDYCRMVADEEFPVGCTSPSPRSWCSSRRRRRTARTAIWAQSETGARSDESGFHLDNFFHAQRQK